MRERLAGCDALEGTVDQCRVGCGEERSLRPRILDERIGCILDDNAGCVEVAACIDTEPGPNAQEGEGEGEGEDGGEEEDG